MQRVFYVGGLPRSGSTLLMNLLGQNPVHAVTPTSGLCDLVAAVRDGFPKNVSFQAEGIFKTAPKVEHAIRGLIEGYHEDALNASKAVFDKSRGWPGNIELLEKCFHEKQKVIVCVRDVRAVVASFEKLHRQNPTTRVPYLGDAYYESQTLEGRVKMLLNPKSVVGIAINRVRDAMTRGLADRLIVVPYGHFTEDPRKTMARLHDLLELTPFEYDPDNVQQITHEDDGMHGVPLHTLKSTKVVPHRGPPPWSGILPEPLAKKIALEYEDINKMAAGK